MSAPSPTAPQPGTKPERPDSVSIATELWIVVILGQLVAFVGQYPTLRDSWLRQIRELPADTPKEQLDTLNSSTTLIIVLVILGVALTAISVAVVWFTRIGYNWARVITAAMGVFMAVNLVFALFGHTEPAWVMIPMVLSGVAGIGASVALLRRESEQYCRDMATYRAAPRYPVGPPPYGFGPGYAPGPGYPPSGPGYPPGSGQWPYGGGQQNGPYDPHSTDRSQPNEGNQTRGDS